MPYFEGELLERNGEQEYTHRYIVQAKNMIKAREMFEKCAQTFYYDEDLPEEEDGGYYHLGGQIFVAVDYLQPTTKKEWLGSMFNLCLLKGGE